MLAAESHLKGRNDMKKYELARKLKSKIDVIRRFVVGERGGVSDDCVVLLITFPPPVLCSDYTEQLKSKQVRVEGRTESRFCRPPSPDPSTSPANFQQQTLERQIATSLYFIDKLALRAGGEKDTDEEADTVGCCNLRVEHVKCLEDYQVEFDFLGKDSIRYVNTVKVDPQVWKNVKIFQGHGKGPGDDLFDRLNVCFWEKAPLSNYLHHHLTFSFTAADVAAQPVSADADAGAHSQGVSNLQRLDHAAGAAQEHAGRRHG